MSDDRDPRYAMFTENGVPHFGPSFLRSGRSAARAASAFTADSYLELFGIPADHPAAAGERALFEKVCGETPEDFDRELEQLRREGPSS